VRKVKVIDFCNDSHILPVSQPSIAVQKRDENLRNLIDIGRPRPLKVEHSWQLGVDRFSNLEAST
jgi:hypothetical protein